ncbi:hypothetical protein SAMN05444422_105100 [Halobiforma haloterrestris]|uniref:HVO-0234-like beta-propeller domain-containing protein n=1 Tax=Natronobacterium haloterrestre TaxID=148448 RepID=A0A1I1GZ63_NATHA|nr:hypothetical protein [Halobiforma haloterrestris]SFC16815.1 hypothetical protein SAMN05444422_105100 [Halobiforma haloterrestris]
MLSIEEKRVYDERRTVTEAYVSSAMGVVQVRIAGDTVGEFALCERCDARDVAAAGGQVAIATGEDVLVLEDEDDEREEGADPDPDPDFAETGFGPAVAVGYDGTALLAASPDGRVARRPPGEDWVTVENAAEDGPVEDVRAIDGDLVGTDAGVYRVHDGALDHAGLTEVRDVAAAGEGAPLAATDEGLYKLGNGWMEIFEGPFDAVAVDPRSSPRSIERAHAVAGDRLYAFEDGEWAEADAGAERIVGVAYGDRVYAVTEAGTVRVAGPESEAPNHEEGDTDSWRDRSIGVRDVTGLAVR